MVEIVEYDCFICDEPHVDGDRRYFPHQLYMRGVIRTHEHTFTRSDGAVFAGCYCGAKKEL